MKKVAYYCETDDNQKITIRREKHGPTLATASQCLEKEGVTDIHFQGSTICFEHTSVLHFFQGKHCFVYNGKKYHWKGHTALIDDESGVLLAAMHTRFMENQDRLGTLVITPDGRDIMDIAVITCLVMHERSEEGRRSVILLSDMSNSDRTCRAIYERGCSVYILGLGQIVINAIH
jgi:hypothetical protein